MPEVFTELPAADAGLFLCAVCFFYRFGRVLTAMLFPADCIEAGLPYDWKRLGVGSEKEEEIVRALLAATKTKTKNHIPPTSTGHDSTTTNTAAPPAGCQRDKKKADAPEDASGGQGIPAAAKDAPTTSSSRACGNAVDAVGRRGGSAATTTAGAMEGRRCKEEGGHGGGSSSSDGAQQFESASDDAESLLNGGSTNNGSSSVGLACSGNGGIGGSDARGKATGAGVNAAASASEIGRWDSVRLKEVKELAPGAEYWEIRMVLARLKSGWCGY